MAFLNSKAIEWLLEKITGNLGGNSKIGQKSNFIKLAIPQLSKKEQQPFIELVEQQLQNPSEETETKIDQLVYKLYGLTQEEITFIENREY